MDFDLKHAFILICLPVILTLISTNAHTKATEKEYCSRNVVCIKEIRSSGNKIVAFIIRNKKNFPITVTVGMKKQINMVSNKPLPHTETLDPYQTKTFTSLSVDNPKLPWKWWVNWNWKPGPMNAEHNGHVYALPYASGQSFKITKGFNEPASHLIENAYCLDWEMPEGTPVHASRGGVVGDVLDEFWQNGGTEFGKKGNYVWIIHDDGTGGVYLHLKQYGSNVKIGQKVNEGDLIGWSGNTGYSDGPHLHFGVYRVIDGWNSHSVPVEFRDMKHQRFIPQRDHSYESNND